MNRHAEETDKALEEVASDGTGAGIEAESPPDEGAIKSPFDPDDIDVITERRTIDLLLTRLKEHELDLSPDFQRRGNLWNELRKSSLIESLLLGIPIPSFYVAEDAAGNYAVVDGLQRMCAMAHFVDVDALNSAVGTKLPPLRLTGLQSLKQYEDDAYAELPRLLQRRMNETELTLHIIRASTPDEVKFNIFSRINQGGLPLASQEIRNALYRGEWRERLRKLSACDSFLNATEGKIKGERMEDIELILRFIAHYSLGKGESRPTDQNLDTFLNNFVETVCSNWKEEKWNEIEQAFDRAMRWTPKVFGNLAFRKYSEPGTHRRPINRGLFEAETVVVARCDEVQLEIISQKSSLLLEKFRDEFAANKEFQNALLYATGRGGAANKRITTFEKMIEGVLNA